jgi:hypothetical protein
LQQVEDGRELTPRLVRRGSTPHLGHHSDNSMSLMSNELSHSSRTLGRH